MLEKINRNNNNVKMEVQNEKLYFEQIKRILGN